MFSSRKIAVSAGRGMVRVRWKKTKELITAGVCPGCWNEPERRFVLVKKMDKIGVEPVYKDDLPDGVYRKGKKHAPLCPNKKDDPWEELRKKMKKFR